MRKAREGTKEHLPPMPPVSTGDTVGVNHPQVFLRFTSRMGGAQIERKRWVISRMKSIASGPLVCQLLSRPHCTTKRKL